MKTPDYYGDSTRRGRVIPHSETGDQKRKIMLLIFRGGNG